VTAGSERKAPLVDALELLGLLTLPTLLVGLVAVVANGRGTLVAGIVTGGLFGAILAGLRRGFYAVRTEDGIERRLRIPPDDPDNVWVRLTSIEYDPRYDRFLALVFVAVGLGSFTAIPLTGSEHESLVLWLVLVGVFGLVAALLTYGTHEN
jgi:hypothetical protein